MKKKYFVISATLSLCVFFTACGNSSAGTNNQVSSNSGSASSAVSDVGKTSSAESKEPVVSQIENKEAKETIENSSSLKGASVGDIIKLGTYEQDNNSSNGKEEIEWVVLAKEGDKALVISKYALDCKSYNSSYKEVTWETCTLRKWLNDTFISHAFSSGEQNMIQTTTVTADNNPEYDTPPGNNTTDKVFLLSIPEANKYFGSDEARMCAPTEYAKKFGVGTSGLNSVGGKATCEWWLRSPGLNSCSAARVLTTGSVVGLGNSVHSVNEGVRPAMWIKL